MIKSDQMYKEIFLDTSIGIKRIQASKDGERVRNYLRGQNLFTSTYVLLEFKRTVLMDAISLHTILDEGQTLDDVYYRLYDMLKDTATNKVANRWILLLGLLGYPRDKNKHKAMKRLENYIRKTLILEFLKNTKLLKSNVICSSENNKPVKREGKYELNMKCRVEDCNIKETIVKNKSVFEEILTRTIKSREPNFVELSTIINEILDDINNIRYKYCKRLGDIIIAIDCPDEMELCTSDHHFDLICDAVGKSYHNPLTP